MSLPRLLVLVALAAGAYHLWTARAARHALEGATNARGFVSVPMPDGMATRGVVVFAPKDCPSEVAQRAQSLVSDLGGRGIPVRLESAASFSDLPDTATQQRVRAVMQGEDPVVFVNGRAKGNPTLQDVVAEYRDRPRL